MDGLILFQADLYISVIEGFQTQKSVTYEERTYFEKKLFILKLLLRFLEIWNNIDWKAKLSIIYPVQLYTSTLPKQVRAARTEAALSVGSDLKDEAVLHGALDALTEDIHPDGNLLNPSEAYRVDVAKGFLYKVYYS